MAFGVVVDERAFEGVGHFLNVLEVVGGHRLGVLLAQERHHHPAGGPVVGLDAGHPLEGELHAHLVGALPLEDDRRFHLAHRHLAGEDRRLDRLDLLLAAARRDVLGDDLVDREVGGGEGTGGGDGGQGGERGDRSDRSRRAPGATSIEAWSWCSSIEGTDGFRLWSVISRRGKQVNASPPNLEGPRA